VGGDDENGKAPPGDGSMDEVDAGGDGRIVVRVPPPEDDEVVLIDVRLLSAHVPVGISEVRIRVSRAVTVSVARGGLLLAVTAIGYATLPGQRAVVIFVALTSAFAVIAGSRALRGTRRPKNEEGA
jgi:hypothetical protein